MKRPLLRLGIREAALLIALAVTLSLGINAMRQDGIPLTENWTDKTLRALGDKALDLGRAKTLQASGAALFVDARDAESFAKGHVAGALNLPYDPFDPQSEQRILSLPKDRWLVLYCSAVTCPLSKQMAEALTFNGYDKVLVMAEGFEGWKQAGGSTEGGQ